MEAFRTVSGIFSTVFAIAAGWPYLRAIIKGRTRPHQLSWLVFTIMNGIVVVSQFLEGGRRSILINLVFFISNLLILALAVRYGTRNTSRFDWLLFALALLTIFLWVLTQSNVVAIWLSVLVDVCATSMMVIKIHKDPASEDPFPWLVAAIAYVFSGLALIGTPLSVLYVRPVYGILCDVFLVGFITYGMRRTKRQTITPLKPLT